MPQSSPFLLIDSPLKNFDDSRLAAPNHTLKISYKPLWDTLIDEGTRKQDLRKQAKISAPTIVNLGRSSS